MLCRSSVFNYMRRLVNRAGVRLRYWADGPEGRSAVHVLGAWEDGELLVEPVEGAVVLADTQQQARHRACAPPRRNRLPGQQEFCSSPLCLPAGPWRRL